jgi:hypothetical protein
MNCTTVKFRFLSSLCLVYACIAMLLLWLTSLSFRAWVRNNKHRFSSAPKCVVLLRILAKRLAKDSGWILPACMLLPAMIGGVVFASIAAFFLIAALAFLVLTLLPVLMPMPSRELADLEATNLRYF